MRYATLIVSAIILAAPTALHAAECTPVFVSGDQSVTINGIDIEPFGTVREMFQIRVRNDAGSSGAKGAGGSPPCPATIRVSRLSPPSDPDFPPYTLRAPGNQMIDILPDESSGATTDSDVDIANAPPGTPGRNVPFHLELPTEWGLRAGTYTEQLRLTLFDETGAITDRSTLTITIVIPVTVSIRLIGAVGGGVDGPARVDLGELSKTTETRSDPFGALIFSTAPYVVNFDSDNLGNLMLEGGSERIPYELSFDGAPVNLSGANEFPYPTPTPKTGRIEPLSIVVQPVVAPAGRYSDRVTVTVTAM